MQRVAAALRGTEGVAVLTGAGISAESGLRTFRGASGVSAEDLPADMRSLWKEFDPQTLATPEAFEADPERVTRWYDWRRLGCLAAEPNAGHVALAAIERKVGVERFTLLTQNVDRLHQRAGSADVVELHGSIIEWRCTSTGERTTPGPEPMREFPPRSPFARGALLRPDVVWFVEMLPARALARAQRAAESCDVFFSIGTSAHVYPAAGFIQIAHSAGAMTIEVNAEPTPISDLVDYSLRGRAGDILPEIVRRAWGA